MKKLFLCCILSVVTLAAVAQDAVKAYAKGNDSYLLFTDAAYDAAKQYTVIRIWQDDEPAEIIGLNRVSQIVDCSWKTAEDLNKTLEAYAFQASVLPDKKIQLQRNNQTLNTTSANAYLVLLDLQPQLLCSGAGCEDRIRLFFALAK